MNPSYGWKEYLSDEVIPNTEDSLSLWGDPPPVFFPFSLSETLPASPEERGGGASESEGVREYEVPDTPSPPFRPPIIRRPARMKTRMRSGELGDFDLLCHEAWGSDFLSEENPRGLAISEELEANSEELEAILEEPNEWWPTASKAHLRMLAHMFPILFPPKCAKQFAGRRGTSPP
ncbi:uncharacterized protein LOC131023399 [Salvia miltiorrhiza]|uniref:uncharacterized protein LOC131023399 n=1 Tax=Salvia miltiorrhiza TaxID=226208 RepID=UPI0025AC55BF|nr:uncharacterized protein LOC131023399 [Salvia miltiorrhiza]